MTTNPLVMTLTESSNNAMSQMAQEGASSGFFSGLYETARITVSNNPVAIAAGVTAIGIAGLCWYGYRNWGWFGGDSPASAPEQITEEQLQAMVDKAIAQAMTNVGASVAPATAAAAPAAPAAAAPATGA